jgi:hypothetical protein
MDVDKRINNLKIDFTKVIDLKNENVKMFETLEGKIGQLKIIYSDFIKSNKQNLFIFGLDSFHFQGKLIDIEYDDMKRLYSAITNRIYCEYFKLYKIVVDYITENIPDDKKIMDLINVNKSSYPIYKDLEPFKQYDFEIIQSVHETIITLLGSIHNYFLNKEHDLKQHQIKNATGLNIDNFIHTFNYNNVVLREKLTLFVTYIEFFHRLHTKYFMRFTTKMKLFTSQILHDIKFEDSVEIHKMKRKSIMDTLMSENVDKEILHELKNSVSEPSSTPKSTSFSSSSFDSNGDIPILGQPPKRENTLEGIFLNIDEPNEVIIEEQQKEEQKDEQKKDEKYDEEIKEKDEENEVPPTEIIANKPDGDDMSILTTATETKSESQSPETKPKRKYTPRKKKTDPASGV